jgi:hypothetical protein
MPISLLKCELKLTYLTKMVNDLLKVCFMLLYRQYIHWQHQDVFLCEVLANF